MNYLPHLLSDLGEVGIKDSNIKQLRFCKVTENRHKEGRNSLTVVNKMTCLWVPRNLVTLSK